MSTVLVPTFCFTEGRPESSHSSGQTETESRHREETRVRMYGWHLRVGKTGVEDVYVSPGMTEGDTHGRADECTRRVWGPLSGVTVEKT